jgi:predicted dehydrogenase
MYSKTAIENGLDVFCEKPLTADFQEAEELFTLAEREGKVLYTDYEYINSPSVNRIKEMIDQLVEIQCIRMTMCQFGRFYSDSTAMETLGVHLLSIIEYLFPNYRYSINSVFEWSVEGGSDLTSQTVLLIVNDIPVELHVSLACPRKERQIRILSRNRIVSCNMMGETNLDKLFIEDGNISFESTDYFDNEKDTVSYSINEFCEYVKNRTVINRNWMISRKVEEVLHAIKDTKNHQPTLC